MYYIYLSRFKPNLLIARGTPLLTAPPLWGKFCSLRYYQRLERPFCSKLPTPYSQASSFIIPSSLCDEMRSSLSCPGRSEELAHISLSFSLSASMEWSLAFSCQKTSLGSQTELASVLAKEREIVPKYSTMLSSLAGEMCLHRLEVLSLAISAVCTSDQVSVL